MSQGCVGEKRGSMSTLITWYPRLIRASRTEPFPENKSKAIALDPDREWVIVRMRTVGTVCTSSLEDVDVFDEEESRDEPETSEPPT